MGNQSAIHKFQEARLCQWIGANDDAEKLLEEIEQMDEDIAYILKPVVRKKKKDISYKNDNYRVPVVYSEKTIDLKQPIYLFDSNKLKPENKMNIVPQFINTKWKYSVSVVSKIEGELRLEVRGYNPQGSIPQLTNNNAVFSVFNINSFDKSDADLIWYSGSIFETNLFYISVDRWGLLSGTAIVKEDQFSETLAHLHSTICELDQAVWKY